MEVIRCDDSIHEGRQSNECQRFTFGTVREVRYLLQEEFLDQGEMVPVLKPLSVLANSGKGAISCLGLLHQLSRRRR